MPSIQVKLIDQVFTTAQRNEVISRLTEAIVSINEENMPPVTLVVIEDVHTGKRCVDWKAMRTEAVRTLAAGKS